MEKREPSQEVVNALSITAEIYGKDFTRAAATMLAKDLLGFPADKVLEALSLCRRELRTFPTVSDIVSRIQDGRPGPEEAWGMVPADETGSCVWSDEMASAYGSCLDLLNQGDRIAGRMAFLETYRKLVAHNRSKGIAPKWSPSFGTDPLQRDQALLDAVRHGRLGQDVVKPLLREPDGGGDQGVRSIVKELFKPMPGAQLEDRSYDRTEDPENGGGVPYRL